MVFADDSCFTQKSSLRKIGLGKANHGLHYIWEANMPYIWEVNRGKRNKMGNTILILNV